MGSFSLKVQLNLHEFDSQSDHKLAASGDMESTPMEMGLYAEEEE
jgi:hypothetical protein